MNTLNNEIEKQFYPVHTAWNETDKVYSMQLDKPSKAMTNWITIIDDPSDPESFLKLDPKDIDFPITVKNEDLNLCAELFLGRCEFLIRFVYGFWMMIPTSVKRFKRPVGEYHLA